MPSKLMVEYLIPNLKNPSKNFANQKYTLQSKAITSFRF